MGGADWEQVRQSRDSQGFEMRKTTVARGFIMATETTQGNKDWQTDS